MLLTLYILFYLHYIFIYFQYKILNITHALLLYSTFSHHIPILIHSMHYHTCIYLHTICTILCVCRLISLLSKENRKQYTEYIEGGGKSIYDLLIHELSSCKVPLADLLHILPSQQARYYTISSSSSVYPTQV